MRIRGRNAISTQAACDRTFYKEAQAKVWKNFGEKKKYGQRYHLHLNTYMGVVRSVINSWKLLKTLRKTIKKSIIAYINLEDKYFKHICKTCGTNILKHN